MKKYVSFVLISLVGMMILSCSAPQSEDNGTDNAAIANIMSRKSVRSFTDQDVSEEQMTAMLRCAMASPSGMNIQPWSFVVVKDKSRFEEVFGAENFNMRIFRQAAAVVVFCADTTVVRPPKDNPDAPGIVQPNRIWRDDMGACTENFLLAAESLGLGAVWTACYPYPDRMDPVRKALSLPSNVVPYCSVAVGYPANDENPKDKWKPERIHYENW